ncbi:hypothetical protein [Acidimangrovimonas pyrenivorans]|uniref:GerMN domain-containing protein n=1 Tax=Acidimangrovimonas pyrenivorans TaxID=2030798 RepID=A0ABV7AH07_9RHOB
MPPLIERRRLRLRRDTLYLLLAAAVFGIAYFGYLAVQNYRAEAYYEELRKTDPVRYLDDLRKNEGFANYLDKFRLLEGYYAPKAAAPPFLVGRWTLQPRPLRVAPGTVFADCQDVLVFERGLVEMTVNGKLTTFPTTYRIYNQSIQLMGLNALEVKLVSYGAAIDHLELTPPGRDKTFYGYRCGD